MFTQHTLTAGFDERKASRFTLRRTGKLAVSLAAFVAAGALVTGAAPASAAVRPAVSASAAYNRTTTNVFYYQAVLGTSFTATLQTNDGWNGNIVQFNWLNHSTSTGLNSWLYLPGASSFRAAAKLADHGRDLASSDGTGFLPPVLVELAPCPGPVSPA